MNLREIAAAFAVYNRWMNEKIYDCAARLTDEQRLKQLGQDPGVTDFPWTPCFDPPPG